MNLAGLTRLMSMNGSLSGGRIGHWFRLPRREPDGGGMLGYRHIGRRELKIVSTAVRSVSPRSQEAGEHAPGGFAG